MINSIRRVLGCFCAVAWLAALAPSAAAQGTLAVSSSSSIILVNGVAYSYQLTAQGGSGSYSFAVTGGSLPTGMTLSAAGLLSGTPTITAPALSAVTVTATDTLNHATAQQTVSLNQETFGIPSPLTSNPAVYNRPYVYIIPFGGGTSPYTISASNLPPGITAGPPGGAVNQIFLSGLPAQAGVFNVLVNLSDSTAPTANQAATATITVTIPPATLTLSNNRDGNPVLVVNNPYSNQLQVMGGTAPYTFQASGLPAGLAVNAAGQIVGALQAPQASTPASVTVTDAAGMTASITLNITGVRFGITSPATVNAANQVPFVYNISTVGQQSTVTYSALNLPGGLVLDPSRGIISGIPNSLGTAVITLTATDAANPASPATLNLHVNFSGMVVLGDTNFTVVHNLPYSYQFVAQGGTPPYHYVITSLPDTLPFGITLTSSGLLSGTAVSPSYQPPQPGTLVVTDSAVPASSLNIPFTIGVASSGMGTPVSATGTAGATFSYQATAAGGTPPYTYTGVDLPPGLSLSSSGLLSGAVPSGNYKIGLKMIDAGGVVAQDASLLLTVPVSPGVQITSLPSAAGLIGKPLSYQFTQSGGVPPYAYTLVGGLLPPGMTLGSGVVNGTPTAAGVYTATFMAQDSVGATGFMIVTFTVAAAPAIVTPSTLAVPIDSPYSVQLQATGGVGAFTWSAASLPAGLSLNGATGVIAGTVSGIGNLGPATATVIATDTAGNSVQATITFQLTGPLNGADQTGIVAIVGMPFAFDLQPIDLQEFTYAITGGSLPPGLILATGGYVHGTPTQAGSGTVTISVTDKYSGVTTQQTISVQTKAFGVPLPQQINVSAGSSSLVYPVPVHGGTAPYTFSAQSLPPGLSINSSTGIITGALPGGSNSYSGTVVVSDSSSPQQTVTVPITFTIQGSNLYYLSTGMQAVGVPFDAYAWGGIGLAPYSFSFVSGSLPPGLHINQDTSEILGIPTTTGTFTVTVRMTDAVGESELVTGTFTIGTFGMVSENATFSAPGGAAAWLFVPAGIPYQVPVRTIGGAQPITFSATGLPDGLTINAATGAISGIAQSGSSAQVTVMATDSSVPPQTVQQQWAFTVGNPAFVVPPMFQPITGQPFQYQITSAGGAMPYTYSAKFQNNLSSGLTVSPTGLISGTPAPMYLTGENDSLQLQVTDNAAPHPASNSQYFSSLVRPFGIGSPRQATAHLGTSFSYTLPASGGTWPYAFEATALPAGLVLNSATGVISGAPTVSGTFPIWVYVTDSSIPAETAGPALLMLSVSPLSLAYNGSASGSVGVFYVGAVTANGGTAPYTYSLAAGSLPSGLILGANGVISGTPAASGSSSALVTVTDNTGNSNTVTVTITITNGASGLHFTSANTAQAASGVPFQYQITAVNGMGPLTYSATGLPTGLTLDPVTGLISGTTSLSNNAGSVAHTVVIGVADASSPQQSAQLTLQLTVAPLVITSSATVTAVINNSFNYQLTVAGGTGPYDWLANGALPGGLSLSRSGVLSGLSVTGPATSVTVPIEVTDEASAAPNSAFQNLTINLVPYGSSSPQTATTVVNSSFNYLVVTIGGTTGGTWSATGLPPGLSINPSTGMISGSATQTGVYPVTINVFEATSPPTVGSTTTLTIAVAPSALQITSPANVSGVISEPLSYQIQASGGVPPYAYGQSEVTDVLLPLGMAFQPNGVLSGTPERSGVFQPTFYVTDSQGTMAAITLNLAVAPIGINNAPTFTTAVGIPARYQVNGVADVTAKAPFHYTATGLPAGLTVDPNFGAITGTPTTKGSYPVTLGFSDSSSTPLTATEAVTVNVVDIAISGQSTVTAVVGMPFSYGGTASGGSGTYNWSVTGGTLPAGLSLNAATGVVSGSPTGSPGTSTVTLTATDGNGKTGTATVTAVVANSGLPNPLTAAAVANVAFTYTIPAPTGSAFHAPFGYSIGTGSLPSGFNFNGANGTITGTGTSVGVISVPVTVTDSAQNQVSSLLFITITGSVPVISNQPADQTATQGSPATFTVAANGNPAPSYTWYRNGTQVTGSSLTPQLTIPSVGPADATTYFVVVSNGAGSVTSRTATLTVNLLPTIGTAPVTQSVVAGGGATFTVTPAGTGPFTYQWAKNGIPLNGQTSQTLNLTSVELGEGGVITVTVTSPFGSVTSAPVDLDVAPPAPVLSAPASVIAIQGRAFGFAPTINATTATFTLTGTLPSGMTFDSTHGLIGGTPSVTGTFPITITATNPTSSSSVNLQLIVQSPPPVITSKTSASGSVGTAFTFQVVATNTPTGFSATGLPAGFTIDPASGLISGTPTVAGTFTVKVTATNSSGGVVAPIVLTFQAPPGAPGYTGPTGLSATEGTVFSFAPTFSHSVTAVTASAPTTPGTGLPPGISVNATTGALTGTPTAAGPWSFTLTVTGTGGSTAIPFVIIVNPAAGAPVIAATAAGAKTATVGTAFSFTVTASGTPTGYAATNLPPGLAINSTTGAITGTPTAIGLYNVVLTATNTSGTGPAAGLLIQVNPSASAPVITSPATALGTVGIPFSYTLAATSLPTSFAITNGMLPAGLTLDPVAGTITGTPTTAGTATVFVAASSTAAGSGNGLGILFMIQPAPTTPVITSSASAAAQVGQAFTYQIAATNSPTSFGATGLPDGLTVDAATGVISGVPTTPATTAASVGLTATNLNGVSAPKILSLSVVPAAATPVIGSAGSASGQVGVAFTFTVTANNTPTSFAATGLPSGLAIDPTTGIISGTPTVAGSFTASVQAGNAAGVGAAANLDLVIAAAASAPSITNAITSVTGKVGVAFTYQITAGPGTITGYNEAGTFPTGLSLNTATGLISGTPTSPGAATVSVTATNSLGTSNPQAVQIAVFPADDVPVVTSALQLTATVGQPFTFTVTATNLPGTTPFPPADSLDAAGLPPGLAINPSTGVIAGTPTQSGSFTMGIQGVNAAGTGPLALVTFTVAPAANAPAITSAPTAAVQAGTSFSYQIAASNGPIVSYDVQNAPAWLAIDTVRGGLTGVPTIPGLVAVQLTAANSVGTSAPANLSIMVFPAANTPVVTSPQLAAGSTSSAFSYQITATNTPTSFLATSVTPPNPLTEFSGLPPGVTLNAATGALSGTPTASGTFYVGVAGANGNGQGGSVVLVITIQSGLKIQ